MDLTDRYDWRLSQSGKHRLMAIQVFRQPQNDGAVYDGMVAVYMVAVRIDDLTLQLFLDGVE